MSSHLNISPYIRRAHERIALENGVVLSPADDGRTAGDPAPATIENPPLPSQWPSVWEALSIAIVGGLLVIAILRGILGHF